MTTPPLQESERAEFEAWIVARQRRLGYGAALSDAKFLERTADDEYAVFSFQYAWEAWRTRASSSPEPAGLRSEPVGSVIRITGKYHSGGYCADIFCERMLPEGTKLYAAPLPEGPALAAPHMADQLSKLCDILIEQGFKREEDWLVSIGTDEAIHIDTLSTLTLLPVAASQAGMGE